MKLIINILLIAIFTSILSSCDPAFVKVYLIKKNEKEIYSKSQLELYGKKYQKVFSVVDSICTEYGFKINEFTDKEGFHHKEYYHETRTSNLIISMTPENKGNKNIELSLMDFLSTRQSELSRKIEDDILENIK